MKKQAKLSLNYRQISSKMHLISTALSLNYHQIGTLSVVLENDESSCQIIPHHMSLVVRKPVFRVSDQVRHKLGCTIIEDCEMLEILDLGRRGIVLSV